MYKHRILGATLFIIISTLPFVSHAALTVPFGGRVLLNRIPSVTCADIGTGPVVLSANLASLGAAAYSGGSGSVGGAIGGAYGAIPLYVMSISGKPAPKPGDWMLGRHNLIPSFSTCYSTALSGFPVPVKKTNNYGVSTPGL